jgi:FtsZ-binding cell division protein ZapB
MGALDSVKLLESKIARAIELVNLLTEENSKLSEENKELKRKNGILQDQINELDFLVLGYKEDQQHIEKGIRSAIDKLDGVEDSIENKNTAPSQPVQENPAQPAFNNDQLFHEQGYHGNGVYYSS